MNSLEEWASEGESKIVDETERRLRYQIRHMIVCDERIRYASSRVAPQENDSCPSILDWDRIFLCKNHIPIRTVIR